MQSGQEIKLQKTNNNSLITCLTLHIGIAILNIDRVSFPFPILAFSKVKHSS